MKTTREELKQIVKNNINKEIGIRGTDEPLNIGQILETSYEWDYLGQISSYDTDNPVELGGVCATDLLNWNIYDDQFNNTDEDLENLLDYMLDKIEEHRNLYKYNYNYIIISESRNPLGFDENDEGEIILEDAEVVSEI